LDESGSFEALLGGDVVKRSGLVVRTPTALVGTLVEELVDLVLGEQRLFS
jgi:hypothetical protein